MLWKRVRKPKPPPGPLTLDYARPRRRSDGPGRLEQLIGLPLGEFLRQLVRDVVMPLVITVAVVVLVVTLRGKGCAGP